ncbi:SDR family oxidoreductase [Inquilinus limosus]|uniref:SDR family oxidoreductase n=1 Tax=Inquilinus limosus TaxID=171674 RepID=UPI003F1809BC
MAMRVVLAGSTGFLGKAIHTSLDRRCDDVVPLRRDRGYDLERPSSLAAAPPQLSGADGLIIAAGVLSDDPEKADRLADGIIALLDHAAAAVVPNLVLISSIGADARAPIASLRAKAAQETALLNHRRRNPGLNWTIVRPSLACGPGGASTRLLASLATLPLRPRVRSGPLRPVHVDDLAEAVVGLLHAPRSEDAIVDACGPDRVDLEGYVRGFEQGAGPGLAISIPDRLVRLVFRLAGWLRFPMAGEGMLQTLRIGADGDPHALSRKSGVTPRPLAAATRDLMPASPVLRWLLVLGLAPFWIWSGVCSVWLWPIDQSAAIATQAGVPDGLAVASVYIGGILDIMVGAAMLPRRTQYAAALAAVVVTAAYVAIMTVGSPLLWLHPLGPVAKGLPLAIAAFGLAMLAKSESARSRRT